MARAAVERELEDAGRQRGGGDAVIAGAGVDDQTVVGAFRVGDVHLRRQAEDRRRSSCPEHVDDVVAVGRIDDDRVGRRVAGGAADRSGEVDVDRGDVGAREIVDHHRVDVAERGDVDLFDVVQVHHDVAEVAREAHPAAIGRDVEDLAPLLPLKRSVSVPSCPSTVSLPSPVPLEDVVAGAQERDIVALIAVDEVMAVATEQRIGAVAARMVSLPVPPSIVSLTSAARCRSR